MYIYIYIHTQIPCGEPLAEPPEASLSRGLGGEILSGCPCTAGSPCRRTASGRARESPKYNLNSFQTTLTPNPNKSYKHRSVTKHQKEYMLLNVLFECFQVPVPVVW